MDGMTGFKPLNIWGAGIRGNEKRLLKNAEAKQIPIVLTWGAIDLIPRDHPLNIGCFGTHGMKAANLAVQNSTEIMSIGCRLDTKATGTPKDFAPFAEILMADIDQKEIDKMPLVGRKVFGHCANADDIEPYWSDANPEWLKQCQAWKAEFVPKGPVYDLMNKIGQYTTPEDIIVSDTGNTLGWIMQGFPFKGERFIHAFNYTPMGYGLGAAIGAAFACPDRRVVCIVGDGGALMSIQELATIARHNLNIKIILLDNKGHSMCRQTQRQWLDGRYYATSEEGGLGFPDWNRLAESFGLFVVYDDPWHLGAVGPSFCVVEVDPDESLYFQVKFGEKLA